MAIKNNGLLDAIIEYAKTLNDNPSVNDSKFLLAVIDTVTGEAGITIDPDSLVSLSEYLNKLFPNRTNKYANVREAIVNHIKSDGSDTPLDSIIYQKNVYMARASAQSDGDSELSTLKLLETITKSPQGFIADYLSANGNSADQTAETPKNTIKQEENEQPQVTVTTQSKSENSTTTEAVAKTDEKENEDPKSFLSELTDKVKNSYKTLSNTVFGQQYAISQFISGLFRSELLSKSEPDTARPRSIFLFAGPPGVGKTFLAETVASLLNIPFQRYDMSEYSDHQSAHEFIGTSAIYQGSKSGNFTKFVAENPRSIVLLDEIEKAHPNIIQLFLQILDAGRVRDNHSNKTLSLKDVILIFTTNAGKQLYENSDTHNLSLLSKKVILKALEKDINPNTGVPFFPPAICSRFATGNVVMFNHLPAPILKDIAKNKLTKNVKSFKEQFDIDIEIAEDVYTALLLAEGGKVDGRTIKARADAFFFDELFELFRLITSDKSSTQIKDINNIKVDVELPADKDEIKSLFVNTNQMNILTFTSRKHATLCKEYAPQFTFFEAQNIDKGKTILCENDINVILLDLNYGKLKSNHYLNFEDELSVARDFLQYITTYHTDTPVYILITDEYKLNDEEKVSYYRNGVSGVIDLSLDCEEFSLNIKNICEELYQQKSVETLARANNILTYETAQTSDSDGSTVHIKLFDLKKATAVDAEDKNSILSNLSKPDVTFDEIIGAEDAKSELKFFVDYLKNPKKFMGTGISAPKGVLLYGPPGTGKTMLAKAVAATSGVSFISAEGNQFLKKYVGEGPETLHNIFATARKYAPCIIFIDEVDTIARERTGSEFTHSNEEILTALLAEMDGFKNDTSKPVFVLAATNYDVEASSKRKLDPAVLRRFDRKIYVDLPNRDERIKYLKMRFNENKVFTLSEDKILNIAIRSTGMSLAQLDLIIELSMRTAIKDGNLKVTDKIFDEAFESFNSGQKKQWSEATLTRVARHEAGHAFMCWYSGETPSYVTIVARGNHGGYMQHSDNEDKMLYTRKELYNNIRTSLGGRASEIVYYGEEDGISTGASGDLQSATNTAKHMVCTYGMSEKFGLAVIDSQSSTSDGISADIYAEINRILSNEMTETVKIISENKDAIDALVEELMIKNHLSGKEIESIFENHTKK
ncbi:MAG: AAA family ATPase [Ruminococcus sp.]|nr:AAA family ATPase [Ruminococcus sp.]